MYGLMAIYQFFWKTLIWILRDVLKIFDQKWHLISSINYNYVETHGFEKNRCTDIDFASKAHQTICLNALATFTHHISTRV